MVERRYELLGPKDLFMDFAAGRPAEYPIHRHLAELQPGDSLSIAVEGKRVLLVDPTGLRLAQLAKDAAARWGPRIEAIREVRVVALMQRRIGDVKEARYRDRLRVESWELPVVEIEWFAPVATAMPKCAEGKPARR